MLATSGWSSRGRSTLVPGKPCRSPRSQDPDGLLDHYCWPRTYSRGVARWCGQAVHYQVFSSTTITQCQAINDRESYHTMCFVIKKWPHLECLDVSRFPFLSLFLAIFSIRHHFYHNRQVSGLCFKPKKIWFLKPLMMILHWISLLATCWIITTP